jgi:hypothetical protein
LAISARSLGVSFSALAFPPFNPPSLLTWIFHAKLLDSVAAGQGSERYDGNPGISPKPVCTEVAGEHEKSGLSCKAASFFCGFEGGSSWPPVKFGGSWPVESAYPGQSRNCVRWQLASFLQEYIALDRSPDCEPAFGTRFKIEAIP